ncbi:MAG: S-layer homology domain-containing protein [Candidatus Gracilibacteria bacterium]|jgi:hypothetical protein
MPKNSLFFVQKPLRWLFVTFLFGTLSVISAQAAFAASTYTATPSAATVGSAEASTVLQYVVDSGTDASQQTWADADTLTFTLPDNYPGWASLTYAVEWDEDSTDNGGAAELPPLIAGVGNGEYQVTAARVLTVKWNETVWTTEDGDTLRVVITGGATPQYAGAASAFAFGGTTVNADDDSPSGSPTVNVSAAGAAASIALGGNSVVGIAGNTVLTLTIPIALETNDTVVFTMPANLDVAIAADAEGAVGGQFGGSHFHCNDADQEITCIAQGAITVGTGIGTITIAGISSKYAATTQTLTGLAVNDVSVAGADISSDSSGAVTDTTAGEALASLALGDNSVVRAIGNATLTFTLGYAMAADDTVTFFAPGSLDVSALAYGSDTFGGAGVFVCTGDEMGVVTCTASGVINAGTGTIVMSGVISLYSATDKTITSLAVNDVSVAGADISSDSSGAVTDVTAAATLASTNVAPAQMTISSYVVNTISLTTTQTIPSNGIIEITYPSGFNVATLSGKTAGSITGDLDGTWTASVSGQVVTLTQSGGTSSGTGAKTFTLDPVKNPSSTGSTGTYTLKTKYSSSLGYIETATVTADTVVGGTASSSSFNDITNVAVVSNSDGGARITWDDPASDDTSYIQILRGVSPYPVSGTVYAMVAKGTEYYVDTDLEVGDTVTYQLRPTDGSDTGDLTDGVTFTVTVASDDTSDETDDTSDTADSAGTDDSEDPSPTDTDTDTDEGTDAAESVEEIIATFADGADIPEWASNAIATLVEAGVLEGNVDGTFAPASSLNRAEAAAMLWRILLAGGMDDITVDGTSDSFSDVPGAEWYAHYVEGLKFLGLVTGNPDGTYQPAEYMNRAEFVVLALRVYVYLNPSQEATVEALQAGAVTTAYTDLDTTAWYADEVTAATGMGFVSGSACGDSMCFNAEDEINRAEAAKVLDGMF